MKTDTMLGGYDKMVKQINLMYALCRRQLEAGDLALAQRTLARIAQHQAKSSVSLRNVLIRSGKVKQ